MSIGFLVDDDAPVIWRGPMASGAAKQFMSDVNWGELDYTNTEIATIEVQMRFDRAIKTI